MKYMVMECHPAYAVLMDEASRFVHAANLHYEVGQIIESPVLLKQEVSRPVISHNVRKLIAAAACFALMAGAGTIYYRTNYTVYSSIVVSAAADMRMEVSRSGKVLSVQPLNQDATQLLADYDCKGKDQLTVTNELIQRAAENGYLQKGDTVHVYFEEEKNKDSEKYKNNVEQAIEAQDLTADVHGDCDVAMIAPHQPAAPQPTENVTTPQTVAEPAQPRGNAVIDPEQQTLPHPDVIERPGTLPETPAAPEAPKHTPGAEPVAPAVADPPKDPKHPETPAENRPTGSAEAAPGPKATEPVKGPAAPIEPKPVTPAEPVPAPKKENPVKDPEPAQPQKPEPAAPGSNDKTPEEPDPGRNEAPPHENAPVPLPHEDHAHPDNGGITLGPQAAGPTAGTPHEPEAPEHAPISASPDLPADPE